MRCSARETALSQFHPPVPQKRPIPSSAWPHSGAQALSPADSVRQVRGAVMPTNNSVVALVRVLGCVLLAHQVVAQQPDSAASPGALKKLTLEQLMNLEVTSVSKRPEKLSQAASAIQVITQEEIRRSGVTSLPEAQRLASNLEVAQVDSHEWAISARGFNGTTANKLLVLIDGRSVYTPLFSGVFWDVQDTLLEDVDRIEVITGPGATLWGANAVNGVINILTKSARDTQGLLLYGGGGTEQRAFGGIRYGGQLSTNAYYRIYTKYFDRDDTPLPNGADGQDAWQMGQGGFRVDWYPGEVNQLTFQGDGYGGAINQAANGDIRVAGGNLLGRWSHTFSEASDLKAQFYYDRTHRKVPLTFAEDLDTYDFDLQHRFPLAERQDIVWGLDYGLSEDRVANTPNFAFLPAKLSFQLFSAFAQDEITLVRDRLRLTLGTKFEHNDFSGFEFQPSGRLSWTVTSRQTLWAAISRAVRTPSRIDTDFFVPANPPFALAGGPKFVSEELLAYELGYRVRPIDQLSFSLATFYNDYSNLRSLEPGPPIIIGNGLKGETYGAELAGSYQTTSWWRWQAGYTYLQEHIRLKSGSMDFNQGRGEGSDPQNQFSIRSSMDLPGRLTLDAALRYVDVLHNIANGVRGTVPSYVELDARLSWTPIENLELSVVGQNLLHSEHPEFGFPTSRHEIQRGGFVKVTWRF